MLLAALDLGLALGLRRLMRLAWDTRPERRGRRCEDRFWPAWKETADMEDIRGFADMRFLASGGLVCGLADSRPLPSGGFGRLGLGGVMPSSTCGELRVLEATEYHAICPFPFVLRLTQVLLDTLLPFPVSVHDCGHGWGPES